MYDAFGKIGSDVEGGNVNRPGSQRECLSVEGPQFRGQYCQVFLKQVRVHSHKQHVHLNPQRKKYFIKVHIFYNKCVMYRASV